MSNISIDTKAGKVEGACDTKFKGVLDAFVKNFEANGEVGASVALNVDGKPVVDLWGGKKTPGGEAWTRDTVSIVFSSTKGATALCAHVLADRGKLDLDAPVAKYWPEFAQNGKEDAIVSMALDHSIGLPHIRPVVKDGGFYDYAYMIDIIEKEAPFWVPGTRNGYHAVTLSWTVGELVHRAAKKRLGQFFRDEVAKPLDLDFWIGLPEEHEPRVAPMIPVVPDAAALQSKFMKTAMTDFNSPSHFFARDFMKVEANERRCHAAELGAANGITNARGLAGMYAPLANGGTLNGAKLVGNDTITRMGRVSMATHDDATLRIPSRFALGYMKTMDNRKVPDTGANASCLLSESAFGHVGAGGSIGFADPECRMSFGYTMNKMGAGLLLNERGQPLVDAAYLALGYKSNAGGAWVR